jgi:predicted SAM-dependent methyltransferase
VDRFAAGAHTDHLQTSVASLVADVLAPMPCFTDGEADTIIARHILEHALDPVAVLREWHRILKPVGGRLIVAMPNEDIQPCVPMDHEHKHGWNPDSFRNLAELLGYRQVAYTPDCGNHVSFVTVLERT